MWPLALTVVLVLGVSATARPADVPVAGLKLDLKASQKSSTRRMAAMVFRDAAIAAPFDDPRASAATVVLHAGAATGQCYLAVALDPAHWQPIGGAGAEKGYKYKDPAGSAHGIKRLIVKPGRVTLSAAGGTWPCGLAASQREPVSVTLRLGTVRWCASFGGSIKANVAGRFAARDAGAPTSCPVPEKSDLTVANLTLLHGIFCPSGSANCRLAERVDLFFQWIAGSGCPDVVTLQEIWDPTVPLVDAQLAGVCPFTYERGYIRYQGVDDAIVLSRYPIRILDVTPLYKNFRHVMFARIDHPLGPVDVFTTHLASGSDGAQLPCADDCPPECSAAGAMTVRQCQGVQLARLAATRDDVPSPAVITGDFNEEPGSFVYDQFTARGWVDTYLAAGNPECDPATGIGCTSGRADEDLSGLESPVSNEVERIDFVFLVPPTLGACTPESAADADGDGTATRIFGDLPNPFAPPCGPLPAAICWPSDHEGAEADLNCTAE